MDFNDLKAKLRGLLKSDAWLQINIVRLFLLGNAAIVIFAALVWVQPIMASWRQASNGAASAVDMYNRYAQQIQHAQAEALNVPNQGQPYRVLPNAYLATAMADVRSLALGYQLEISRLDSDEPVVSDADVGGHLVMEMRAVAVLTGTQIYDFLVGLEQTAAHVRSLRMELADSGAITMHLELSFFGWM